MGVPMGWPAWLGSRTHSPGHGRHGPEARAAEPVLWYVPHPPGASHAATAWRLALPVPGMASQPAGGCRTAALRPGRYGPEARAAGPGSAYGGCGWPAPPQQAPHGRAHGVACVAGQPYRHGRLPRAGGPGCRPGGVRA